MTETEWVTCVDPDPMLQFSHNRVSSRKWRLLGCGACRRIWDFLIEKESRTAVEVAEAFADGLRSKVELGQAWEAAVYAADSAYDTPESDDHNQSLASHLAIAASSAAWDEISLDRLRMLLRDCLITDSTSTEEERVVQTHLLRDIFGNPFRPVTLDPSWRTSTAVAIAQGMYESRDFGAMPILADALQDAGCDNDDLLTHCRDANGVHVRGCWVVDLVLGKE